MDYLVTQDTEEPRKHHFLGLFHWSTKLGSFLLFWRVFMSCSFYTVVQVQQESSCMCSSQGRESNLLRNDILVLIFLSLVEPQTQLPYSLSPIVFMFHVHFRGNGHFSVLEAQRCSIQVPISPKLLVLT